MSKSDNTTRKSEDHTEESSKFERGWAVLPSKFEFGQRNIIYSDTLRTTTREARWWRLKVRLRYKYTSAIDLYFILLFGADTK